MCSRLKVTVLSQCTRVSEQQVLHLKYRVFCQLCLSKARGVDKDKKKESKLKLDKYRPSGLFSKLSYHVRPHGKPIVLTHLVLFTVRLPR